MNGSSFESSILSLAFPSILALCQIPNQLNPTPTPAVKIPLQSLQDLLNGDKEEDEGKKKDNSKSVQEEETSSVFVTQKQKRGSNTELELTHLVNDMEKLMTAFRLRQIVKPKKAKLDDLKVKKKRRLQEREKSFEISRSKHDSSKIPQLGSLGNSFTKIDDMAKKSSRDSILKQSGPWNNPYPNSNFIVQGDPEKSKKTELNNTQASVKAVENSLKPYPSTGSPLRGKSKNQIRSQTVEIASAAYSSKQSQVIPTVEYTGSLNELRAGGGETSQDKKEKRAKTLRVRRVKDRNDDTVNTTAPHDDDNEKLKNLGTDEIRISPAIISPSSPIQSVKSRNANTAIQLKPSSFNPTLPPVHLPSSTLPVPPQGGSSRRDSRQGRSNRAIETSLRRSSRRSGKENSATVQLNKSYNN